VTGDALALSDALWKGEIAIEDHHPFSYVDDLVEMGAGVAFVPSFANVSAFTTGEGLVLVDTGSQIFGRIVHTQVREWSQDPLRLAIYTHGHIDHVFGIAAFEKGSKTAEVVAHEAVPARFDRYMLTAGYNAAVNRRQFGVADLEWPTEYRYPDRTYRDALSLNVGGTRFELHHARGETDDHTWVFLPDQKVLCCGDLFIWAAPNCGNPQKVQRYPREWAAALREMAAQGAEVLLPGHGYPIVGADRVPTALTDTADLLDSVCDQTLALMNSGATLDDVLASVEPPEELLAKPYLRPVYDDPEFIVRNIWRYYGGWYEGDPATLKPAPAAELAAALAELAGGAARVAARAREAMGEGSLRLAGHLASIARRAAPDDADERTVYQKDLRARAEVETSTMAKGIFKAAAED
jgi:alkyl sulfatase BDS1-like metallo-beta-lactamase superfamily hydrolase